MAHINLLPWRAEERERKNRDFISWLVLAFIVAAAIAFFVWYLFNATLDDQNQANSLIEAENAKLDVKLAQIADLEVRREAIISRMKVVQDLQGRRPVPVHVWHDVAVAVPEPMYIISFSRKGEQLFFKGRAANPNVVSNLVTNLDASPWMQGASVRNIQKQNVAAYGERTNTESTSPETDYVSFEVTTFISSELPDTEQDVSIEQDGMGVDSELVNSESANIESADTDLYVDNEAVDNNGDIDSAPTSDSSSAPPNTESNNNDNVNNSTIPDDSNADGSIGVDDSINVDDSIEVDDSINDTENSPIIQDNSIQGNPTNDGQASGGLT